ncbi:hypothetical protein [Amycolatopsis pithecellobii]|uniref:Uncharacterized protein n=1 Tax=Amycolatopsis pithecellobii TaxID=664692 RepID=A0A6N7YLC2_9PSEU|nr:hypothetical protein [Amycolatopsis pithecellobii]MTD52708.1 hypothetical protein [Amycolatopsis pithecellobii]
MNIEPGSDPLAVLRRLHTQLRLLTPAVTLAPDTPEVTTMLAGLAETAAAATTLLSAVEPGTLTVLRRAFACARAHQHNETASELVTAHGRISALLRGEPH